MDIPPADISPAAMLATDWAKFDSGAPADLVPAAYSVSGVFDLTPLLQASMNADLRLDQAQARAVSPVLWPAPAGRVLDSLVGGIEFERIHPAGGDHRRCVEG